MDATTTTGIVTDFVGSIGDVIASNLPIVFGLVASLFALGLLIKYIKRHVK